MLAAEAHSRSFHSLVASLRKNKNDTLRLGAAIEQPHLRRTGDRRHSTERLSEGQILLEPTALFSQPVYEGNLLDGAEIQILIGQIP